MPGASTRLRWLPFAALQASEIAIGLIFAYLSVHVANSSLMVVAGGAFVVLAVTARGSLGIVRLVGPRLHVLLVVVVGVVVGLAPIIPAFRPDVQGIIVIEFGVVGLIRLATFAQTDPSAPGVAGRRRMTPFVEATAVVAEPRPTPPSPAARTNGAPAASPAATGAAARWLGRTTGAAAASGKRVVAQHRPEAEAQAKRTIRSAGRIAGKIASSTQSRPDSPPD